MSGINKLTAVAVRKAKGPASLQDGGGLFLKVSSTHAKSWILRIQRNGKRRDIGLGSFPNIGLEQARDLAQEERQRIRTGSGPSKHMTFVDVFDDFWATKRLQLSNAKAAQQWPNSMRDYVMPHIGATPVSHIQPQDIVQLLRPIWHEKPETAARVLQRLNAVFEYAVIIRLRDWNPCSGIKRILGTQKANVAHHPALDWSDVPRFVRALRDGTSQPMTRLAFEFLILTAVRSGEVRGARWAEIDLETRLWSIPAERMKTRRPHVVPLAPRTTEILWRAKEQAERKLATRKTELVFPGPGGRGELSDSTLSKICRDAGEACTPHGFRSSFRSWCADNEVSAEVAEACLAHLAGSVERAYQRSKLVELRRTVMTRWAAFVCNAE